MNPQKSKSNTYYFILLFVLSFVFRLLLIVIFRFDGLYGQDAYAYLEYSKKFYEAIANFQIPPQFYWPIGYSALASVFTIFTIGNFGLASLIVSLNSGSLCAGFVYLLAYELASGINVNERKKFSLYAGLITAFAPVLVKSSIVIMSDSLSLMFASWAMWQFVKYFNEQKPLHLISSSAFLALAVMTRYGYAFLIVPMALYSIYYLIKSGINKIKLSRDLFLALITGVIIFSPQLYYILHYGIPNFHSENGLGVWPTTWNFLNFIRKDFTTFDGTMHYTFWNGLYNLSPVFHPMYLSIFGITFLIGGYYIVKKKAYAFLILTLSWILIYYIYFSGSPFQALRFLMSFLPAMALVSAFGISELKIKNQLKNILLYAGLLVLILYSFYHMSTFSKQKNNELEVVNAVINYVPDSSTVFSFDVTMAVNHYTKLNAIELFNVKENEIKNKIDSSGHDVYFILPIENIKSQWAGLPLEKKYDMIRSNYPLQTVTSANRFKILKIKK